MSIIIPVRDRPRMLREAIDSCWRATGALSCEVIVVDDASTEDIPSALRSVQSESLVYRRMERNGGPSAARNLGMQEARGSYLKFLDSDDLLADGAIVREVNIARMHEADVVVSAWALVRVDSNGREIAGTVRTMPVPQIEAGIDDFMRGKFVPTPAALYSRETVASLRWDTALWNFEEWQFFAQVLLKAKRIAGCEEVAFWCRVHDGERLSSGGQARQLRGFYGVLDWMEAELARNGALTEDRVLGLAQHRYRNLMPLADVEPELYRRQVQRIAEAVPKFVPTWPEPRVSKRALIHVMGLERGLNWWRSLRNIGRGVHRGRVGDERIRQK